MPTSSTAAQATTNAGASETVHVQLSSESVAAMDDIPIEEEVEGESNQEADEWGSDDEEECEEEAEEQALGAADAGEFEDGDEEEEEADDEQLTVAGGAGPLLDEMEHEDLQ